MRRVRMRRSAADAMCPGARLAIPGIRCLSGGLVKGDTTVILTGKGELVAIGEALMTTEEITGAQKGLAFSVRRVVMKLGTYPKLWKTEQLPKPS